MLELQLYSKHQNPQTRFNINPNFTKLLNLIKPKQIEFTKLQLMKNYVQKQKEMFYSSQMAIPK